MRKKLGLTRMEIITLFITMLMILLPTLAAAYAWGSFDGIIYRFANRNIVENPEEEARIMRLMKKSEYGNWWSFDFRIIRDDERRIVTGRSALTAIDPRSPWHNPFYTDIVFVHTEAEALDFPDNIIVAWPREHPSTERDVDSINQRVNTRPEVTFEEFGLSYPVTVADIVDNWEKVGELMAAIRMIEWWPSE